MTAEDVSAGGTRMAPSEETPILDVVIVSYRSPELLIACMQSLRDNPPDSGTMVVHLVDNASGDGTPRVIAERYPEVRVTMLARNAGFAAANNVALRRSTAPYVLLLNPDTELRPRVLDHMIGLMREHPEVGIAGCRLVRPDGSFDHAAKRSFPTPLGAVAHFSRIGRRLQAGKALAQYRAVEVGEYEVGEVDSVNGAFMLVRREVLDSVGLLDEAYWMYAEDLDWCYRAKRAGWRVLYDGRVSALHVKGGTAGQYRRVKQNVAFHRSMARYYRKFHAGERPLLDGLVYVGIAAKLAASLGTSAVRRRLGNARSQTRDASAARPHG